ncbi:MAG: VCBS repeat-containing protein [Verrucomicrobiae bacterium]|nr:VCBS repeat-containing protein [Verrucomicrobiae bacterium]
MMKELQEVGRSFFWCVLLVGGVIGANAQRVKLSPEELVKAEALAKVHCATCHAWPEPGLLDKETWRLHVLPTMTLLGGHTNLVGSAGRDWYSELRAKGVALPQALCSDADIMSIGRYYIQSAPESLASEIRETPPAGSLDSFEIAGRILVGTSPATYHVSIIPGGNEILVGDGGFGLWGSSVDGSHKARVMSGLAPVSVTPIESGIYVGALGEFRPTERQLGSIHFVPRKGVQAKRRVLADKLPRLADLVVADINGDGREDLVAAMFGFFTGRLSWFEQGKDGEFTERVIYEKPGAVRVFVRDLNADGRKDLVVLIAQATEEVVHFIQDAKGGFAAETMIRHHAAFGSSSLDLADFNGDGLEDVLLANGDFDFSTPPRPYHGVRLFLRTADGYELKYFFQFPGAYQARALDHDLDGDMDIAAVSLTPAGSSTSAYNFALLENDGSLGFRVLTKEGTLDGRWMTMDVADLEGDGDADIVLGSVLNVPGKVPPEMWRRWQLKPVSAMVLRNLASDRKRKN